MKKKLGKIVLGSVITTVAVAVVMSSLLYDIFREAVKDLPMDFENWGEEFIDN